MLPVSFVIWSCDSALGKVNKESFSQFTFMQMFISGILNSKGIIATSQAWDNLSKWEGVVTNEDMEVLKIDWSSRDLEGIVDFEWLPFSIRRCSLEHNYLSGSINLEVLPKLIECIYLCYNAFSGTVNLTKLPYGLKALSLSHNQFSGSVDLGNLPYTLGELCLNDNRFSGEADFGRLPRWMSHLDVSNTQISGEYDAIDGKGVVVSGSKVEILF